MINFFSHISKKSLRGLLGDLACLMTYHLDFSPAVARFRVYGSKNPVGSKLVIAMSHGHWYTAVMMFQADLVQFWAFPLHIYDTEVELFAT